MNTPKLVKSSQSSTAPFNSPRVFGNIEYAMNVNDIASRKKIEVSVMITAEKMGLDVQTIRDIAEYLKVEYGADRF